jgi:endonuclease III
VRAARLRTAAERVVTEHDGDLRTVMRWPLREAIAELRRFPAIGEPGAEKILLLCGAAPLLALDSNGLRVLLRFGYGTDAKSYAASYRSVRRALVDELPDDHAWLTQAHLLLRRHGQEICRRTRPACGECALRPDCSRRGVA